jgi:uncharacterized protein (DUF1330 family)
LTIVALDITNRDAYQAYAREAAASVAEHGGIVRAGRGQNTDVLEGEWRGRRTVVIEWPSKDAALAWYWSPGYQELVGLRQAASQGDVVLVECLA